MPTKWIYPFGFPFFVPFLGGLILPNIYTLSRKRALSKQLTQFSKEITENTPGTDIHDWEVVAANLNSYFYENKVWNTEYFFFNAADCQGAFETTLLEPFSLRMNLPRLRHLRIPPPTSKRPCRFILQNLTKNGSCSILRKCGALLIWNMSSSPKRFTVVSLPGFSRGFSISGFYQHFFCLWPVSTGHGISAVYFVSYLVGEVFSLGKGFPKYEALFHEYGRQNAVLVIYYK
ncbi:AHL_G0031550.mRNA.1.CDS.1 [Saccharomyces cerevisiae]|nr:CPG_1a_G0031460.mRNA.1.CDS.1 [Saccharomyces cerevisiae]CAI4590454.1 AVB_G0031680.mRNA.1.CDS.1 [Saccharomyces cerevisiae]CAI4888613.1 AHL_G0031550.mRNA.1.CDS.1 [Saccharomyces cerevisiae]CAI6758340.1 AHL_G0031550.mRNA.1.CDS.1 [Saccharomyces cerevisiae]CAI7194135.1 AVB_G0031680.mRNA.1.CDS.1 [Saccharomyces cerevisiae]